MNRVAIRLGRCFSPVSSAGVAVALMLAVAASLWGASALHAAPIPVTGTCTLVDAIHAANTDSPVGDCPKGEGSDILVLDANTLYVLSDIDNTDGDNNGLPVITTTITISGNFATIARDISFVCPDPTNPNFRLFQVNSTGNLTLQQVALRNGCSGGSGGALTNLGGIVTIEGSAIHGNRAEVQGGALSNATGTMTLIETDVYLNSTEDGGGGILNSLGTMTLQDSHVYSNTVLGSGGGIMNSMGAITLTNSSLYANTTTGGGGGLHSAYSATTIEGSDVYSNSAFFGGGIYSLDTTLDIENSRVYSNTVGDDGGGAYIASDTATLIGNRFYFNRASRGGGFFHTIGTLTLESTDVFSNTADTYGGGIAQFNGAMTVLASNVYSNVANITGGGIYNELNLDSATMTVTQQSRIESNYAGLFGGGIANDGGDVRIEGSAILANRADRSGGGASNIDGGGTMTITTDSEVAANRAVANGGGVYNRAGLVLVEGSAVHSNQAGAGAGLYSENGTITLLGSDVYANMAMDEGGGLLAQSIIPPLAAQTESTATDSAATGESALATFEANVEVKESRVYSNTAERGGGLASSSGNFEIEGSQIYSNSARGGGGVLNDGGKMTIRNTHVLSNSAVLAGGIANITPNATMTVTENSRVQGNRASQNGAGFYNLNGALSVSESAIHLNRAGALGGGIHVTGTTAIVTVTQATLLGNRAANDGGALLQAQGRSTITQSCIVGNTDNAVAFRNGVSPLLATGNWWGTADGPSGQGPGSGDSVSKSVDFSAFLAASILECPTLEPDLALQKAATPGVWKPGQTVQYGLRFINNGNQTAQNVVLTDTIPGPLSVTNISTDRTITQTGSAPTLVWQIGALPPGEHGTITVTVVVSPLLTADAALANTASIDAAGDANRTDNTASLTRNVQLPRVHFSGASYSVDEDGGAATITVELDAANPHAAVTVNYATGGGSATPNIDYTPKSGTLTILAGQASVSFTVDVIDDDIVEPDETIGLTLAGAVGARIDTPDSATLTILNEDDDEGSTDIPLYLPSISTKE